MRAPKLDKTLSEENFQTSFYPEAITLYFDEWVQLKNPSQILISPPLVHRPEINFRGKHVDVVFDEEEVLRDSTTYAINFGDAIVYFTESNPVKNFRFIFATGDKIDSLILRVNVLEAYTKKPAGDVVVMLYDQYQDSVVYEEKPYYFAKTDKNGSCVIQNLRSGKFKCFALKDADFNFLYNQDSEQIGFLDSLVHIKGDSAINAIQLELFLPEPDLQIVEAEIQKRGKLSFEANKLTDSIKLVETNVDLIELELLQDSMVLWYQADTFGMDSIFAVLELESTLDTFQLKSKRNTKFPGEIKFKNFKSRKIKLLPDEPLRITFSQIIKAVDTSFFELTINENIVPDTSAIELDTVIEKIPLSVIIDSLDKRSILITSGFMENEKYKLNLFPGSIHGYFENVNDTLQSEINVELRENLGNIFCKFDSLSPEQQYVVLLKKKDDVLEQKIIVGLESTQIDFLLLSPGKYNLEVIIDENRNGRWDPGDYLNKRQSEKTREFTLEELRKNWDIETEIKWDNP